MPGRSFVGANGYRYGFNGKEKTDEVSGNGNSYDYGFRIYNPRLGRFLSVDPLTGNYPWYTPYQFAGNTPIWAFDLDGLEEAFGTDFYDEKQGKYYRIISLNPSRTSKDVGTIQFKYLDKSESKIVANENYKKHVEILKKSLTDDKPRETKVSMYAPLSGPTAEEKPLVVTHTDKKVIKTTSETQSIANKENTANSLSSVEKAVVVPNSPPPLPGGFILGSSTYLDKADNYGKNINNVANWLIENPNFNIAISTDEGIPNGESPADDITFTDFSDFSYRDRTNKMIGQWQKDIISAGKGAITADRLKFTISKPNSYKINAKPEQRKTK